MLLRSLVLAVLGSAATTGFQSPDAPVEPVEVDEIVGRHVDALGGIDRLFPHTIETGAVSRPQRLKVVVEKIEVNPSLEDARFERPSVVR